MPTEYRDYYKILGVPKDADEKAVKSAFRKLARKHHPDVNPGDAAAEKRFKEVNEANEVLSDPDKRRIYDEVGPHWREYQQWEKDGKPGPNPFARGARAGTGPQVEFRTATPDEFAAFGTGNESFSDFFESLFGSPGGGPRRGRRRAASPVRGGDAEVDTTISLEDAFRGATCTVELRAAGTRRSVEVKIPAGIGDNARVRARGQGGAGSEGGDAGDLFVRVHIAAHERFVRDGENLRVRVPVPLATALLGGEVEVPTLRGTRARLNVPPETQNGARLRLRGLGMPRLRGQGSGDLIAEVDVRLPLPLTEDQKRSAEQLRTHAAAAPG